MILKFKRTVKAIRKIILKIKDHKYMLKYKIAIIKNYNFLKFINMIVWQHNEKPWNKIKNLEINSSTKYIIGMAFQITEDKTDLKKGGGAGTTH